MQRTIKYDVLSTELNEAKELRLKLGDSNDENGGVCADVAAWGVAGFISRAADPNSEGCCQALLAIDGSDKRVVGQKDNRLNKRYGEIGPGESAMVTSGSARLLGKLEDITALAENSDGQLLILQLSGKNNNFTLMLPGSDGTTMIQAKSGEIKFAVDGGGSIVLDKKGAHIYGGTCEIATGTVLLGYIAPNVPLVPSVNSCLVGPTGIGGAPSTKVLVAI
jgi:hypothetical protein